MAFYRASSVDDWRWWTTLAIPAFVGLTIVQLAPQIAGALMGSAAAWDEPLLAFLLCWIYWIILCPAIFWFFCKVPLEGRHIAQKFALHLLALLVFVAAHLALHTLLDPADWRRADQDWFERFVAAMRYSSTLELITFLLFDGVFHAIRYATRAQAAAEREQMLLHQKTVAELDAIRRRLEPHFLFNALNSLCGLIPEGAPAQLMAQRLSDYLRLVLNRSSEEKMPLREELALANAYLEIETLRHGARLAVEFDIDTEALDAITPVLVLQPLIENAVKFATLASEESIWVAISAQRQRDALVLTVRNVFDPAARIEGDGWGHSIISDRLSTTYGKRASFSARGDDGVYSACIMHPYEGSP